MGIIKDQLGFLVGASILGPTLGAIGSNLTGGIGSATQTIVAGGFLGHVAGKTKDRLKFL